MRAASFLGAIAIAVLLAAACGGGPEPVAFRVCVENDTWERPGEEQMRSVWNDPRHKWTPLQDRREALDLSFYRYTGSPSLDAPVLDLAGVTPAGAHDSSQTGACGTARQQDLEVVRGSAIELWTLLYDVAEVTSPSANDLRVHVVPVGSGFRVLHIDFSSAADVHIIGPDDDELDCLGPPSAGGICK